jgi:hypothetical protein
MNIKQIFNVGALTGANDLPIVVSNSDSIEAEEIKSFEIGYLNEETVEFYNESNKEDYIQSSMADGYTRAELEAEFKKVVYLSPGIDNSYLH